MPSGFGFGGGLSIVQRQGENPVWVVGGGEVGRGPWAVCSAGWCWLGWTRELMFVENDYLETRRPQQMFRVRILETVAGIFL